MPLSVAALVSGMMTDRILTQYDHRKHIARPRLGAARFLQLDPVPPRVLAAAIAFMLVARSLLNKQITAKDAAATSPSAFDLVGSYGLTDRWHRLRVPAGSPLIDRSVAQMKQLYDDLNAVLVGFERLHHGKRQFLPALPGSVFETDDAIFVVAEKDQTKQLVETQRLVELPNLDERMRADALQELGAAELMLAPELKLIGKALGDPNSPRAITFRRGGSTPR